MKRGESRGVTSAFVFMGVCGCGKTTVARRFAGRAGIEMLDADDFHPPENIAKMARGNALQDADRQAWLDRLNRELLERVSSGQSVALACSALREAYRETLSFGLGSCYWIYLRGSRALLLERMANRSDHYMPAALLDSQLETLEEPGDALVVPISLPLEQIDRRLARAFPMDGG